MAPAETPTLPPGFLAKPAPNLTAHPIDFAKTDLPYYAGFYALILDNVLSPSECSALIAAAESTTPKGWERAMINIGGGRQALYTDSRNCGRIIWDSRDIVDRVWKRIEHVPQVQQILRLQNQPLITDNGRAKWDKVWRFTRPNERMRFLKYVGGEYFRPHCDGSYETPDRKERSYFTMHLYLNDSGVPTEEELARMSTKERVEAGKSALVGGATTFHSMNMRDKLDVEPRAGRILLFQHRDLLHSGDDVVQGVKYTMRTDLMYTLESAESEARRSKMPVLAKPEAGGGSEGVEAANNDGVEFGL